MQVGNFVFNWKAIIALLVQIGGLAAHPEFMNLLPENWALAITFIATLAQALTQPVGRKFVKR